MKKDKKSGQSISFNNTSLSGAQVAQGNNINQFMQGGEAQKKISPGDVAELIEEMQNIFQNSDLPDAQKTKCIRHLETFKDETQTGNPDKEYAAKTLQKIISALKDATGSNGTSESTMVKLNPVITRIVPWLGEKRKFLVL